MGADPTPPPPGEPAAEVGLREAAQLLGVHYMTAYRYVRSGRLPARKAGDEWRVRPGDLAALRAVGPSAGRAAAHGGPRAGGGSTARACSRLRTRLVAGDEAGSWAVVEELLGAGADPAEVLAGGLVPALRAVGDGWAAGELTIADEHRATAVATRLVARLGPRFARPGRRRGVVVLGAASGDRHQLPTAIMADLVRGAGLDVVELGADTPAASFAAASTGVDRLVAVGVCASVDGALGSVRRTVRAVRRANPDVPVLVGGGAVRDAGVAGGLGADGWAEGAAAVELFRSVSGARPGRAGGARSGRPSP